jgi:hypothetical protein
MAKKRKFKSYTKRRTNQEEYEFLIEVRDRLQFRLSHQNECFINCIRTEELDLARVIREIQVVDEIGFGMLGGSLDLDPILTGCTVLPSCVRALTKS